MQRWAVRASWHAHYQVSPYWAFIYHLLRVQGNNKWLNWYKLKCPYGLRVKPSLRRPYCRLQVCLIKADLMPFFVLFILPSEDRRHNQHVNELVLLLEFSTWEPINLSDPVLVNTQNNTRCRRWRQLRHLHVEVLRIQSPASPNAIVNAGNQCCLSMVHL